MAALCSAMSVGLGTTGGTVAVRASDLAAQSAPLDAKVVQGGSRGLRFFEGLVRDEGVPSRRACVPVRRDRGKDAVAVAFGEVVDLVVRVRVGDAEEGEIG